MNRIERFFYELGVAVRHLLFGTHRHRHHHHKHRLHYVTLRLERKGR